MFTLLISSQVWKKKDCSSKKNRKQFFELGLAKIKFNLEHFCYDISWKTEKNRDFWCRQPFTPFLCYSEYREMA